MSWKPVELQADYWIILDENGYDEYQDEVGDHLMFYTQQEAQAKINLIKEEK
jgi:hypothetical protein